MLIRPEIAGRDKRRAIVAASFITSLLVHPVYYKNHEQLKCIVYPSLKLIPRIGATATAKMIGPRQTTYHETDFQSAPATTSTTSTTNISSITTTTLSPAQKAAQQVSASEYAQWSKVNICEESGNWHTPDGGLGILPVNWVYYGGYKYSRNEALATPDEQIVIARRIQPNPPDQNGCDGPW